MLDSIRSDVKHAARMFARTPGFTLIAVVSLSLGLGANAAIFSLVNELLIRSLPYRQPDQLVRLTGVYPRAAVRFFQDRSHTASVSAAGSASEIQLKGKGLRVHLVTSAVSTNFFNVLGVSMERGRGFRNGEDAPGADHVLVISHDLWKARFHGDPGAIGRMISLNGAEREIVGIAPSYVAYPTPSVQAWIPLQLDPSNSADYWGGPFVPLIGRLKNGNAIALSSKEVRSLLSEFRKSFPYPMSRQWNDDVACIPLRRDIVGDVRPKLLVLLTSAGIVLLIACANMANLLLVRAISRRKEIVIRSALGASRARMWKQLITESLLLSLTGVVFGVLIATALLPLFKAVLPSDTPGLGQAGISWPVMGLTALTAILVAIGAGLAPALMTSDVRLTETIKTGSQKATTGAWTRLRGGFVAAEVALSLLLLTGAALLLQSMGRLLTERPGFNTSRLVSTRVSANSESCTSKAACTALFDRLLANAKESHTIQAATLTSAVPLSGDFPTLAVDVEGHPKTAEHPAPMLASIAVSANCLPLLHIPVLSGRGFAGNELARSEPVLLISASTARYFWPHESALGKQIKAASEPHWRTVIGVVGDVKQFSLRQPLPDWIPGALYMPYAQATDDKGNAPASMSLIVSARQAGPQLEAVLRNVVQHSVPDMAVAPVEQLDRAMVNSVSGLRAVTQLFLAFAGAATFLAGMGIYGLLAYWVNQRTYEIGLRVALGASPSRVIGLVFRQGMRHTVAGIVLGALVGAAVFRVLNSLLYGITATDPLTLSGAALLLLVLTGVAGAVPAWRATRIAPANSLRAD